jgi:hypothetical protein
MKKIIRLTERDLTRIVKRVISESSERKEIIVENPVVWGIEKVAKAGYNIYKWYKLAEIGHDLAQIATNATDIVPLKEDWALDKKKSLSNLFYWGTKNTGSSDVDYKTKINTLYNAMEGGGTWEDDVEEVMGSLKNMNQLSKLIHNWKSITGSDESLYDWLLGDMWDFDVWDAIGSWKDKYKVYAVFKNKDGKIITPVAHDYS